MHLAAVSYLNTKVQDIFVHITNSFVAVVASKAQRRVMCRKPRSARSRAFVLKSCKWRVQSESSNWGCSVPGIVVTVVTFVSLLRSLASYAFPGIRKRCCLSFGPVCSTTLRVHIYYYYGIRSPKTIM